MTRTTTEFTHEREAQREVERLDNENLARIKAALAAKGLDHLHVAYNYRYSVSALLTTPLHSDG